MKGLYIHVPFCKKKCLYCDFYSLPFSEQTVQAYVRAVKRNLKRYDEPFDTVYFGGGTPILLAEYLGEILSCVNIADGAEITAEANPCEMLPNTLETMLRAGINRISVGVQSFSDKELIALGRRHDAYTAEQALKTARTVGFRNISADLMLGIPVQTGDSLMYTLDRLCKLDVDHVSAYMLKIEENTPFGRSVPLLPDEDETAELYLQTVQNLAAAGLEQYEISNFAKKGMESRHNLKYWRREEYVGIGPAAHSFYDGKRFAVPRDIERFIYEEVQPVEYTDDAPDEYEERVMLGLRLAEGIPNELYKGFEDRLRLVPDNYYKIKDGRLSLTAEGFLLSNEIIALLLAER